MCDIENIQTTNLNLLSTEEFNINYKLLREFITNSREFDREQRHKQLRLSRLIKNKIKCGKSDNRDEDEYRSSDDEYNKDDLQLCKRHCTSYRFYPKSSNDIYDHVCYDCYTLLPTLVGSYGNSMLRCEENVQQRKILKSLLFLYKNEFHRRKS